MSKKQPINPPDWLDAEASAEWARLVADGFAVTTQNCNVLAAYCQQFSRYVAAERILTEHGTEVQIRDDKGVLKSVVPSPQVGMSRGAFDRMLKAAAQLQLVVSGGRMTVSTAKRVEREPGKPMDFFQ